MSLLSLPDDLVGYIFSLIPDGQDRRALFSCCKQLHNARSICQQYSTLTIFADQLRSSSSSSSSSNPFLCFPEGAQLKKLVLERARGGSAQNGDSDSLLLRLLKPTQTDACLRVSEVLQNLEEARFKGFQLSNVASISIGGILGLNTQLRAVEIEARNDDFAPFLSALAAFECGLRELCFRVRYTPDTTTQMPAYDSIHAIGKLVNLEALSIVLSETAYFSGDPIGLEEDFAPIADLTQLRSLSIQEEDYEVMGFGEFSSALVSLQRLQHLSLPRLPTELEVAVLPESLVTLGDTGIRQARDVHHFCNSLIDIASNIHHLPRLQSIDCLALNAEEGPAVNYTALPQALFALSHLHLNVESVRWVDNFDDLLSFFEHAQALAKAVKRVEIFAEPDRESSTVKFARLSQLCPSLTCIKLFLGLPCHADLWDPACLFGARQLRSLRELRLVFSGGNLGQGDLGECSHSLLSIAVALSAKGGPPLTIVLEGSHCEEKDVFEADISLLRRQWASIGFALECLNCDRCDVLLQVEIDY